MSARRGKAGGVTTTFGGLSRSELMSRIRSGDNATTEMRLVELFRKAGVVGWRRNYKLEGKPDFVFPDARVAVFADGCFWHGHGCPRNLSPKTNVAFWKKKIRKNRTRDQAVTRRLNTTGWRVIRIWECRLKNSPFSCIRRVQSALGLSDQSIRR
jgi:DNA mismatch endonuclease, patch repair protein